MPSACACSSTAAVSSRVALTHVTCAMAVSPCWRWMRSTMARVFSRVLPPAPYVTEQKSGFSAPSAGIVFSSSVRSPSGVLVGKNSNEITGRRACCASAKMSRMKRMCRYPIAMRIVACLLAVLCAARVGLAQEAIEWSLERRLTRNDFKGRVPAGAQNAALSWLNIDASWECQGAVFVASARATFDPSRSWWRSTHGRAWASAGERMSSGRAQAEARRSVAQLDVQLLEHEQLHFDLAEAVARKIRARFNDFRNACSEAGGT